jgi:hypothetical protein
MLDDEESPKNEKFDLWENGQERQSSAQFEREMGRCWPSVVSPFNDGC